MHFARIVPRAWATTAAAARHMGTRKVAYTGSGRDVAKKRKSRQMRRGERHDSVSTAMLAERENHLHRINDDVALGNLLASTGMGVEDDYDDEDGGGSGDSAPRIWSGYANAEALSRHFRRIEERVEELSLGRRRGFACRKRFGQMLGATTNSSMPVVGADLVRRVRTARGDLPPTAAEAAAAQRRRQRQQQRQGGTGGVTAVVRGNKKQQPLSAAAMVAAQIAHEHGGGGGSGDVSLAPEIGIIGHSNSGKSSLVNALAGKQPSKGLARVSQRAGWTSSLDFYSLRLLDPEAGPSLVLVDMPGYGPAVADARTRRRWWDASLRYARQGKAAVAESTSGGGLRCMLVLVDASRGFCEEDEVLFALLAERGCPFQVVLTKADLLPPPALARCNMLLTADLRARYGGGRALRGSGGTRPLLLLDDTTDALPMVSALHLQGVSELFESIVGRAFE